MKKHYTIVLLAFIGLSNIAYTQNVNIPDANFKAALVENLSINTNGDGEIQVSEATAYTGTINVYGLSISNLTGIEVFTNLTQLNCGYNNLTSLNVSANTALTYLDCFGNQLTNLDVSSNTTLTNLKCFSNQLTSLNVSTNTALTSLECGNNQLSSLDLSTNTALTNLNCNYNQLMSLNVSANIALIYLACSQNQLTSLNVSANTALTNLECIWNQLTSLDVSANTALIGLECRYNLLTSLDVTANTYLTSLFCDFNQLTSLNVSANTTLTHLMCSYNQLTGLDVSSNMSLIYLHCKDNFLTSLNVKNGNNINFTVFNATDNPNLVCIQVDNALWSTTNWTQIDAWTHFSELCTVGIESMTGKGSFNIFPNPCNGIFTITCDKTVSSPLVITNVLGEIVYSSFANFEKMDIDLTNYSNGFYYVKFLDKVEILIKTPIH